MNTSNAKEEDTFSHLLQKLCNHFANNNSDTSAKLVRTSLLYFTASTSSSIPTDQQFAVDQIRKMLIAKHSPESLQKFDLLYARLQKNTIFKNLPSTLTFLLALSGTNTKDLTHFSMLHELQSQMYTGSNQKMKCVFLPDNQKCGVKKLYSIPSESKLSALSSVTQISQTTIPTIRSISDNNLAIALKEISEGYSLSSSGSSTLGGLRERQIMQEVIYSLQGIEGVLLKKEPGGLGFTIDTKAGKLLTPITRSLAERLANVGFLHNQLKQHCDEADKQTGVIGQSLIAVFREELTEYYKTVAVLQAQLKRQGCIDELTLRRMVVWVASPLMRLQWLVYIAEQCADKKGGALISAVHGFLQHGATFVQEIAGKVLSAVCRPFYHMMSRWILDGELSDPCGEFFIETRHITSAERLWHDKYHVKPSMVPSFTTMDQAKKILATGKSINFLRQICKDSNQLPGREALQKLFKSASAEALYAPEKSLDLHTALENVYRETSLRVLDMLRDKYHLLEHLQALRRYLLLGQGDFIRHLLELLAPELTKPAQHLYGHTLSAILESAIRVTTAQFEDEDILQRLNVFLMRHSHGDIGWDVFSLVYIVDGPVGTILEPAMAEYRSLFGCLWKAKRMEYVLSNIRKQQITSAKIFRNIRELRPIMHSMHILSSEMIHFLHQTQYYFLFEVLECSWAEMLRQVNQAECLDDIIIAHNTFLSSVQCGVLLDSGSETSPNGFTEMCAQLRTIYNLILHLEKLQETLFTAAWEEHSSIVLYEQQCIESQAKGRFGVTLKEEVENRERIAKFHSIINYIKGQIKQLGAKYRQFVEKYLKLLALSTDTNLQLLSIRLNFNDYYKIA